MINGSSHGSSVSEYDLKETDNWKEYIIVEETCGASLATTVMSIMKDYEYLPLGPPTCTYCPPSVGGRSCEETIWIQAMMYNGEENNKP